MFGSLTLAVAALASSAVAWNNGVSKVPSLGYNTWNHFGCSINETLIHNTATSMKNLGYLAAGYKYINLDDCWMTSARDSSGNLVADPAKFPSGMKNLTTYLHGLGFLAGIYDQGTSTCAGFPGSLNHELADATLFANWGFDYVKIDNCNHNGFSGTNAARFQKWTDALNTVKASTGKMLVYSLVEWQSYDAWIWGPNIANSWRIYTDIQPVWGRMTAILNNASFIGNYTNFNQRNDLDMLEVGNGKLSLNEQRSHFTAWALNKSPLLIGADVTTLSTDSKNILINTEILAINQDQSTGAPLVPFYWGRNKDHTWDPSYPGQYWSGYYGNTSTVAIMYLNTDTVTANLSFQFSQSPHLNKAASYSVRDLWAHQDLGTFKTSFSVSGVGAHDVRAYVFKPV